MCFLFEHRATDRVFKLGGRSSGDDGEIFFLHDKKIITTFDGKYKRTIMNKNPFITSGYVSADYFCDREQESKEIIRELLWHVDKEKIREVTKQKGHYHKR